MRYSFWQAYGAILLALKIGRKLDVSRQLDMIWENFRQLIALSFLSEGNEVHISGVASGASTVSVSHGLGRVPRGYLVTRQVKAIVLYEVSSDASSITFDLEGFSTGDREVTVRVY